MEEEARREHKRTQIIDPNPEKNEAEHNQIEGQLQSAIANDMLAQFLAALHKRYTVSIDRQAVNTVVSTDSAY